MDASTAVNPSRPVGDVHVPLGLRKTRYGCEHVKDILAKSEQEVVAQYSKVIQALDSPHPTISLNLPRSSKFVTLKPTYLCLQCPSVESFRSKDLHDVSHKLCAESTSGALFCRDCGDYVHDPTLETVRSLRGKKRKYSSFLSDVDSKIVANNTTPVPCRALALRGLYNMGQTCFMSVVLQSLIHNPFIRAYYLTEGHRSSDCERDACTSCALDDVFVEFHSTEKAEGYGMVSMLQASWKGGGSLAGYQQQDAHEYLQFTLNSLHTANLADNNNNNGTTTSPKQAHGTSCTCIIHNTFGGLLQSTVTCGKCKNTTTVFDPFMDLSLDVRDKTMSKKKQQAALKEAAAAKDKQPNSTGTGANSVNSDAAKSLALNLPPSMDLSECLDRFTSLENLSAADYTCQKCDAAPFAVKRMSVSRLPLVLPIHLKRFSHHNTSKSSKSVKLDTRVKFPLTLDMRPYCRLNDPSPATKKKKKASGQGTTAGGGGGGGGGGIPALARDEEDNKTMYDLSSVVVHHGKMDSGHYINYARVNDEWFMFDDSKVVLVDESQVLASEAYMLFYVVREVTV